MNYDNMFNTNTIEIEDNKLPLDKYKKNKLFKIKNSSGNVSLFILGIIIIAYLITVFLVLFIRK